MTNLALNINDSDMPVDAKSIPVDQERIPANVADFISQITADGQPPFHTALIKGSRDDLANAILRQCGERIGLSPQAKDFAHYVQNLVKSKLKAKGPNPTVIFSMSGGGPKRGRVDVAEPNETAVFATLNADTEIALTCPLPAAPKMPDMTDMAINRGIVLMAQPLLDLHDPTGDNRGQGMGPGAEAISGERNRDPVTAGNLPHAPAFGGPAYSTLFTTMSFDEISRNILRARDLDPSIDRTMAQNPPEESLSADALEEEGIPGADQLPSAIALGAAYTAMQSHSGPPPQPSAPPKPGVPAAAATATLAGGERRATGNMPNFPHGRRDAEVAAREERIETQAAHEQQLQAAHEAAERRAAAQHKAGAYQALEAEAGVDALQSAGAEGQVALNGEAAIAVQDLNAQGAEATIARQEATAEPGLPAGEGGLAAAAGREAGVAETSQDASPAREGGADAGVGTVAAFDAAATAVETPAGAEAGTREAPESAQQQNSQGSTEAGTEAVAEASQPSDEPRQLTLESGHPEDAPEDNEPSVGPASLSEEELAGENTTIDVGETEAPEVEAESNPEPDKGEKAEAVSRLAEDGPGAMSEAAEDAAVTDAELGEVYEEHAQTPDQPSEPRPDARGETEDRTDRSDDSGASRDSDSAGLAAAPQTGPSHFAQDAALHGFAGDIAGASAYHASHIGAAYTAFTAPPGAAHAAHYAGFTPAQAGMGATSASAFASGLATAGAAYQAFKAQPASQPMQPDAAAVATPAPTNDNIAEADAHGAGPGSSGVTAPPGHAGFAPIFATSSPSMDASAAPVAAAAGFSPSFARRPLPGRGAFVSVSVAQMAAWQGPAQMLATTTPRRVPNAKPRAAAHQARTRIRKPTQAKPATAKAEAWSAKADGKTRAVKQTMMKLETIVPALAEAPSLDMG